MKTAWSLDMIAKLDCDQSGSTANDKIDICRGLFAFLVVAAHCRRYLVVDPSRCSEPVSRGGCTGSCSMSSRAGVYWVIGFFVISGYCIQLSVSRADRGETRFR